MVPDRTESKTHHFASLVRQCSTWCLQSNFKTRAKVLQRDLTWQGYNHRLQQGVRERAVREQLLGRANTGPGKTPASALPTPNLATTVQTPATSKAPTSAAAKGKGQSAAQQRVNSKESRRRQLSQHQQPLHHQRINRDQQHHRLHPRQSKR